MTAFVDTNLLIRHLTGDPPDLAARATAILLVLRFGCPGRCRPAPGPSVRRTGFVGCRITSVGLSARSTDGVSVFAGTLMFDP